MNLATGVTLRPLTGAQDAEAAFALFRQAMLALPDLHRADPALAGQYLSGSQQIGAFDADRLIGTTNGYASEILVSAGKSVPHLSVTHVGVLPGENRKGVARAMLHYQLRQARAAGFVVAGLRASDARIYPRYGYGLASWAQSYQIDLAKSGLPRHQGQVLRAADPIAALPELAKLFAKWPLERPAALRRWPGWWAMQRFRLEHGSYQYGLRYLGAPGAEQAFLRFHSLPSDNWLMAQDRTVVIDDLQGENPAALREIFLSFLAQDIVDKLLLPNRPKNDPLLALLPNPRAVSYNSIADESWIRILDLPRLLAARGLNQGAALVIAVQDPLFPDHQHNWRMDHHGAVKTNDPADLDLSINDLTSLIFGAWNATELADAGRIDAKDHIIEQAAILFQQNRQPHAGISF